MQAGKTYQGSLIERKFRNCKPFSRSKRIKFPKNFRRFTLFRTASGNGTKKRFAARTDQNLITVRMLLPWCIKSKASLMRSNGSVWVIIGSSLISPLRYFST
jgi:hypothetical protein